MPEETTKIVSGPDKPALQWALAYPDREEVHFKLDTDGIDAKILKMEELGEGFSFAIHGVIKSGPRSGTEFHAIYSVETRSGTLSINAP